MKAYYLIPTLLFVFTVYATNIDISIKKMVSENICTEYSDSENTENDMEEKLEDKGVEDDLKEFASLQHKPTQTLFQSKLYVIAALVKLEQPIILLESPPPNI